MFKFKPNGGKAEMAALLSGVGGSAASLFLFGREILANPRAMGAICPSSPKLARHMAAQVPLHGEGLVVELGGGTGTVTAALLEHGVDPRQLVIIERSPKLARHLQQRFPHLRVIQGDAAQLSRLLPSGTPVRAVVSGLPLRSLPTRTVHAIAAELEQAMVPDSLLIQFTYSHRALRALLSRRFQSLRSRMVWGNLPPARVDVYRLRAAN